MHPAAPLALTPEAAGALRLFGSNGPRVAAVLCALAQGLYRIDAMVVAEGLLATVAPARRH